MSLISDNQKKAAQVPSKPAPLPKAAPSASTPSVGTSGFGEFTNGAGELGLEQALPETIQVANQQPTPPTDEISQLTDVTRYMGGGAERVPLPEATVPVAPPVSLWKDASVDFGANNLFSGDIVTTQSPSVFASSVATNTGDIARAAYGNLDYAGRFAINQQQVQQQQAAARAAEAQVNQRANLPNVPDVDKPWHEQAINGVLGFGKSFLFGTDQSNKAATTGEFNPLNGSYGVHGAGVGGALKAALSIPIGIGQVVWSESDRLGIEAANAIKDRTNPVTSYNGKTVRWNTLTRQQKLEVGVAAVNNKPISRLLNVPELDYRTANRGLFGKLKDTFTGQIVADDIDNANPNLPGEIINRLTGERITKAERNGRTDAQVLSGGGFARAIAKDKPSLYRSRTRRPGQPLQEDPSTLAWSLANQLASPGNKIDFVGNAAGELAGALIKPIASRVFRKPTVEAATSVAEATKPDPDFGIANVPYNVAYNPKPRQTSPGMAPISQPARISALPVPSLEQAFASSPAAKRGIGNAPQTRLPAAPDPKLLTGGGDFIVPAAKAEESLPRITMEARLETPAIANILEQRLLPGAKATPAQLAAEVGIGTAGREITFDINGMVDNLMIPAKPQPLLEGAANTALPVLPSSVVPRTLAELVEQSTDLAAQRTVFDSLLSKLEDLFESTLDVGRRAVDELPTTPATVNTLTQAMEVGAKLPNEMAQVVGKQLAEAIVTNDTAAIAAARNSGELNNTVLEQAAQAINAKVDFNTTTVNRTVTPVKLATNVPATIYHGTALRNWTQDYNVREFGSRGELGSGLYTTVNKAEATNYSRASVGENRSANIAYDVLEPQVVELSTRGLKSTLDARQPVAKPMVQQLLAETGVTMQEILSKGNLAPGTKPTYVEMVAAVERVAAGKDSSEQSLQRVGKQISEALRKQGYDSVYDNQSGWLMLTDNLTLNKPKTKATGKPKATEAAVARYNADTKAAEAYPGHITTDANLRDSAYKVLDQVRSEVDEKLGQVQQEAIARIAKEEVKPVAEVDQAVSNSLSTVFAENVATTSAQIKKYGMSAEPLLVRKEGNTYKIVGNAHVAEAAKNSNLTKVNAVVVGGKGKQGHLNVDLAKVVDGSNIETIPTTTSEVLRSIKTKKAQRVFPIVQLSDNGKFYTVVSKDWAVNAFQEATDEIGVYQLNKGKLSYKKVDVSLVKSVNSDVPVTKSVFGSFEPNPAVVAFLGVKNNSELLSDSLAKVDDLRSYVDELVKAKASADEINEAVVAAQRQAVVHVANNIRYSSTHVPNVEKSLVDARQAAKLTIDDIPMSDARSQTIVNNLRVDKQEQRLLVSTAKTLVDNADAGINKSELEGLVRGFEAAKYQYDNLVKPASTPVTTVTYKYGDNVAKMLQKYDAYGELTGAPVLRKAGFSGYDEVYELVDGTDELVAVAHLYYSGKLRNQFNAMLLEKNGRVRETGLGKMLVDTSYIETLMPKAQLEQLAKENARIELVSQPAPVNPHANVREMLDNTVDDICNF